MASIVRDTFIAAPAAEVWDAVRDVGALHTSLVPGFVIDTQLEPGARLVTFADGQMLREKIIALDDAERRLVWSVVGGPFEHHNGATQVFEAGDGGCRVVWRADLLPDALAVPVSQLMERGLSITKATFEKPEPG